MNRYKFKDGRRLRCGYTTGACAAAAAKAAAEILLSGAAAEGVKKKSAAVTVCLPDGSEIEIPIEDVELEYAENGFFIESTGEPISGELKNPFPASVMCSVRKDAGDDADVTDGLLICARVRINPVGQDKNFQKTDVFDGEARSADEIRTTQRTEGRNGDIVQIDGGIGVGRVTKPGLDRAVGEAAINTVPRQMITEAVLQVCERVGFEDSIFVEISVPKGVEAAAKTFNPMLGIEGGISILGTSGIVEPMSDAAIVETIRTEIRVKSTEIRAKSAQPRIESSELRAESAAEIRAVLKKDSDIQREARSVYLAAVPGNYGMKFACEGLQLREKNIVKCSNFIGDTLDAACEYGLSGILLIGNAGKLIKLAAGIMNTHSSQADCRIETVIACSLEAGASLELLKRVSGCVTTEAAFSVLKEEGLAQCVLDIAAERAAAHIARRVRSKIKTGVILFSSESGLSSYGGNAAEILRELREATEKR